MITPTKTTLNSKLPTVSKIAFCTAAGKNMATKIYTGENGKFTRKVGFKQNAKTYPYQIQYRQRSRYTATNAKIKGASWTNWSAWRNAVAVSGIPINTTETERPVNRWLKANKGINKNGTYQTFFNFTNYLIPDTYDAREFQFRIRTINKSKARHGSWTTQTIKVFKRAAVVDEFITTAADGGLKIKFNYIWERAASIVVNSIKDSGGRELVKKAYTAAIESAIYSSTTTPAARANYAGGKVTIPIKKLKRKVKNNEALTLDIKFVTEDGAPTPLASGTVTEQTRVIGMTITKSWEEERGLLTVMVTNNDESDLADLGCNISYTYNNKKYSVPAFNIEKNLASGATSTFYFYPPYNIPLTLQVKEEDIDDYKDVEESETFTCEAKGYRFNKVNSMDVCGVAWGNASYEVNLTPQVETALPYGRAKNIIFYGEGTTNEISFSATLIDKPNLYGGAYGGKAAWDRVSNNQGLYYFRTSKGELYLVGLSNVSVSHETKDLYSLSASMTEVV